MQIVELKRVRDETVPLAEFFRTHLRAELRVSGNRIEIEGAEHDEVKLLFHKFLHQRGLSAYKVHSQSGIIEIIPHDKKDDHKPKKEMEGRSPTSTETTPYFFPGRAI